MLGPYRFDNTVKIKSIKIDLSKAHISMIKDITISEICTIRNGRISLNITDPQVKNIYFACTFISTINGHTYDIITNGEVWYQPNGEPHTPESSHLGYEMQLPLGLGDKKAISHAISCFADLMEIDN